MKVEITQRKDNPFLKRKELKGTIEHAEEPTPSADELREYLAKELSKDSEDIVIDKIFTLQGKQTSKFWAKELNPSEEKKKKKKTKKKETKKEKPKTEEKKEKKKTETKKKTKSKKEDTDLEEVLGGTISEAKEKIGNMDNPDLEALMEYEKNNKDRKGIKKFLSDKLEE